MDFLNNFEINNILHILSQTLLIPTIICLLGLMVYAIYTIGSFVVECIVERRHYKAEIPKLIARLQDAPCQELDVVIESSGLLGTQKKQLSELVSYLYLPEDARTEVARRLLADENTIYQKALAKTDSAAKVGPMLGLMGTLIPLGPGLVALSSGDLETLASSLMIAFDTTVAGLTVAVVCFLVSKVRRRWYSDYLINIESVMNTVLEKGTALHEAGFEFERLTSAAHTSFAYDERSPAGISMPVPPASSFGAQETSQHADREGRYGKA